MSIQKITPTFTGKQVPTIFYENNTHVKYLNNVVLDCMKKYGGGHVLFHTNRIEFNSHQKGLIKRLKELGIVFSDDAKNTTRGFDVKV